VTVRDNSGQSAPKSFPITINNPQSNPLGISGVTVSPNTITAITDRPTITVNFGGPADVPYTATLSLSFQGNASGLPAGYTSPGVQFAQGGTATTISIPQGATSVSLPSSNSIQVGSVAGTIIVTLAQLTQTVNGQQQSVALPNPLPSVNITVPQLAPAISSVKVTNATATGFTVDIVASSTPRDLSGAVLTFTAASGAQLTGTSFTVGSLSAPAASWFSSAGGQAGGGAFDIQIPFNYIGDPKAIGLVSVQLTNSVGSSSAVSGAM
jgi:hypothetical protein